LPFLSDLYVLRGWFHYPPTAEWDKLRRRA